MLESLTSLRRASGHRANAGRGGAAVLESLEARQLLSAAMLSQAAYLGADHVAEPSWKAPALTAQAPAATAAKPRLARKTKITKAAAAAGPIVITKGGVYSGTWQSLNANVPAVQVRTSEPVVIQNSTIYSRSSCIDVYGVRGNVTVRNVKGYGLNPNVRGRYPGRFLDVDGFTNIVAENNYMENTSGIYIYGYQGNHSAAQTVKVRYNWCKNVDGRVSNGKGGWIAGPPNPDYYKQFFQINGVQNIVGAEVAWNQIINEQGNSRVEENINIHNTTGTKTSPFQIHDNYIQGAYAANSVDAKTYTGGGIMTSDNGSSYIKVFNNQIVGTGHIGITITSGHDNAFYNNRIVSDGLLPNGKWDPDSNTGAVIWNFNKEGTFKNNTATGNVIGWVRKGQRADWWIPDGKFVRNKPWPGKITAATERNELTLWQQKLVNSHFAVGPNF